MNDAPLVPPERRIRIYTLHGVVQGALRIGARLRTLDDLNVVAQHFVTLHEPSCSDPSWLAGSGALAVNKSRVLFVVETSDFRPAGQHPDAGSRSRASLALRVGEFSIQGFVHVPPGGDPLKRLNQESRPFLALTSASVVGPGAQFAATFVAVHRHHVATAQTLTAEDLAAAAGPAEEAEAAVLTALSADLGRADPGPEMNPPDGTGVAVTPGAAGTLPGK